VPITQEVGMAAVEAGGAGEKGLKGGALGFVSGVVIGVASTAPGYSLASALGGVIAVAGMGIAAPSIMLVAFVPMLFTAAAYYYLNKADPDCGTTFSWATRALGPWVGWIGGWGIIVADIIVMANLSEVAGQYTYYLFGIDSPSNAAVMTLGVLWIVVMTWICYIGIEVSAYVQYALLAAEIATLILFSVVALWKVYTTDVPGEIMPSLSWLNPFEMGGLGTLAEGLILAIFIYWGWDSTVTVNEESTDATEGPGRAAIWSTVILVLIYVVVTIAAQAFHGTQFLADNSDDVLGALGRDVLGSPFDKLLIIAVLTSAAASTQTTILPTTRTTLSMAAKKALPDYFARVHPRYLTPSTSTIWMGVLSIIWYVGLKLVSENVLYDSIAGLGLAIAFYYGLTAIACPWYYRHQLTSSLKNFLFLLVAPLAGGAVLIWALYYSLFGKDVMDRQPKIIFLGMMALGVVLMFAQYAVNREFFRRTMEVAPPGILDGTAVSNGGTL
jgi:amino acid transporter